MSNHLITFLTDYAKWLDNGAPHKYPYSRDSGLCDNVIKCTLIPFDYIPSVEKALRTEFDYKIFPFGGYQNFMTEARTNTMHLNKDRIAFVRKMIGQKEKPLKNGFYFFTSERASNKSICQYVNGQWFTINEVGPISIEELNIRGWVLDKRVKGTKIK